MKIPDSSQIKPLALDKPERHRHLAFRAILRIPFDLLDAISEAQIGFWSIFSVLEDPNTNQSVQNALNRQLRPLGFKTSGAGVLEEVNGQLPFTLFAEKTFVPPLKGGESTSGYVEVLTN